MKALLFNSGQGSRMLEATSHCHKSMLRLKNGETILERQLRILSQCGIREFIVTTGYKKEQIMQVCSSPRFASLHFTFVENPQWETTNYLYSMHLAEPFCNDDMLVLHGDLVFDQKLPQDVLADSRPSLCLYSPARPLPTKDFKGRVENGLLQEVAVALSGKNCHAFQPFYKLAKQNFAAWQVAVSAFVSKGKTHVYAEDALNTLLPQLAIPSFSYDEYYIDEIDTSEDYTRVASEIRTFDYRQQPVFSGANFPSDLYAVLNICQPKKIMVVASQGRQADILPLLTGRWPYAVFSEFSSNPTIHQIQAGASCFANENCDFLLSFGGGSALDVAKGIKLYSVPGNTYATPEAELAYSPLPHLAIPTTAGTGSESTRFAVAYLNGEKLSLTHDSLLPEYAILASEFLQTLPDYHKKSALLDALCQGAESFWAKAANAQSREYAGEAIRSVLENYQAYLNGEPHAAKAILTAANLAGKAINITLTTAPHALSYQLTQRGNISHGHAVALCFAPVWERMLEKLALQPQSYGALNDTFHQLALLFGCEDATSAILKFRQLLTAMNLPAPALYAKDIPALVQSVNLERMANNPLPLTSTDVEEIYANLLHI